MFWNQIVLKVREQFPTVTDDSIRYIVQKEKIGKAVPGNSKLFTYTKRDVDKIIEKLTPSADRSND